jgi:hypothetical protein
VPDDGRRAELLSHADELERAQGTPSYLERYKAFVDLAAAHVAVIAPFLPALTQLLHH